MKEPKEQVIEMPNENLDAPKISHEKYVTFTLIVN